MAIAAGPRIAQNDLGVVQLGASELSPILRVGARDSRSPQAHDHRDGHGP
jgi:hypothetical protein